MVIFNTTRLMVTALEVIFFPAICCFLAFIILSIERFALRSDDDLFIRYKFGWKIRARQNTEKGMKNDQSLMLFKIKDVSCSVMKIIK